MTDEEWNNRPEVKAIVERAKLGENMFARNNAGRSDFYNRYRYCRECGDWVWNKVWKTI